MEGNSRQPNQWLSKGEIHVLIGYMPIDVSGAQVSVILQERLFLACPKPFSQQVFDGDEERIRQARERADRKRAGGRPLPYLVRGRQVRIASEGPVHEQLRVQLRLLRQPAGQ